MVCAHCGAEAAAAERVCPRCGHARIVAGHTVAVTMLTPPPDPPGSEGSADGDDGGATIAPPSGASTSDSATQAIPPGQGETIAGEPVASPGPVRSATALFQAGTPFGHRYHLIRQLGSGGMGTVYQAYDVELAVVVAIKVIRPEAMADPAAARDLERRFKRELLLARNVTHKNVVRIHDLGEIEGVKYITMPYVNGADLATWSERLTSIETADGKALLLNIFLSSAKQPGVWFPREGGGLPDPGPTLFGISSPLPQPLIDNARAAHIDIVPGARGFVFNADLAMLVKFLEIGTRFEVRDR